MDKLRQSIRKRPINLILMGIIAIMYVLNNRVIKRSTVGWVHLFTVCYLNDIMAPLILLPYANILLGMRDMELKSLLNIEAFCLAVGLIWEFVTPLVKKGSVTDPLDLVCYCFGGFVYWLILRRRGKKRDQS